MKYPPVHYHDYLGLPHLLGSQKRQSEALGKPAHDEMLFIVVHQAYELWFKQMIFELDSILDLFKDPVVREKDMGLAVARLERIDKILGHILGQIDILETMTPLDFLDFRDYLYPASGFQSMQWRLLETKLGLKSENRLNYNDSPFWMSLHASQQNEMRKILEKPSLFELVQAWLERTPFLSRPDFDFWSLYQKAVLDLLAEDETVVRGNQTLSDQARERSLKTLAAARDGFLHLFDPEKFSELQTRGSFRFSNGALRAALFIQVYRDEPILQGPFRLIASLIDIDEKMTQWRYRHALMVQRMLGKKIGTGGSSGHEYLKAATEQHKIFSDLVNLASYLIPRSRIPTLPESLRQEMNFHFRT